MNLDIHVKHAGKATAYTTLTQVQVDSLRGTSGRGRVNIRLFFNDHEFRTSIAIYRGEWMFVINKAMREVGLLPDCHYGVQVDLDREPKRADAAPDIKNTINAHPKAKIKWDALSISRKRAHLQHVERAKRPETRLRRITKLIQTLTEDLPQ